MIKGADNKLDITLVEGESDIPDRNTYLCELGINGKALPHDLPEGTPLELTVEMNESREVFVTAYISLIDLTLVARTTSQDEMIEVKSIEYDLKAQTDRVNSVSENCSKEEKNILNATISSVTSSLKNAHVDEDEKRKANKQIKDLKIAIDRLEKEKELPQLVTEFKKSIESAQVNIAELSDTNEKAKHEEHFEKIKAEGEGAIIKNDKFLLVQVNEQMKELGDKALFSDPATWREMFRELAYSNKEFINEQEADYYKEKGKRAIELDDMDELKRCTHNLMLLLPSNEQATMKNNLSGITR